MEIKRLENPFFQDAHGMPGFNTKAPFVTTMVQIVVRPKTDTMDPIISITKDGISNTFNNVQVGIHSFFQKNIYFDKKKHIFC